MKKLSRAHYALSVCATVIMLAGCGEALQSPSPTAQMPFSKGGARDTLGSISGAASQRLGPDSSGYEGFSAPKTRIHCHSYFYNPYDFGFNAKFRATGTATGPYPGTFTASGSWSYEVNRGGQFSSSFQEKFAIRSGSSKISGTASMGVGDTGVMAKTRAMLQRSGVSRATAAFDCRAIGPGYEAFYTINKGGPTGYATIWIRRRGFHEKLLDL
jgi:hypothetical protein